MFVGKSYKNLVKSHTNLRKNTTNYKADHLSRPLPTLRMAVRPKGRLQCWCRRSRGGMNATCSSQPHLSRFLIQLPLLDSPSDFWVRFLTRDLTRVWGRGKGSEKQFKTMFETNLKVFQLFLQANCNNPDIVFKRIIFKNEFPRFGTWTLDSTPFQPVPGRKFPVESEFEVKNSEIRRPGAKN